MNRITAALLASLEAVIAAAVGIGVALVPLTVLWATHFDLMVDWAVFWRAAADIWLLGHGVDLVVALDPAAASALGLPGAETAFAVTMAPLGFALLAVLFGVRAGTRAAATGHRTLALAVAIGTYALVATLVTWGAQGEVVQAHTVQGIVLPAVVYATGVLVGAFVRNKRSAEQRDALTRLVRSQWKRVPITARAMLRPVLAGGAAATSSIIAVASVAVTASLVMNYATVIQLYESLQAGILGGATLTLAQLLLLPNLVVWASAWLIGPGFGIGVGSSVSPLGTQLGPVPALPVFGALPEGQLEFGYLGLLVPVLAGFLAGVLFRPTVVRALSGMGSLRWQAAVGAGIGVVGGAVLGLLAWLSSGSMGPGRLAEVGPEPWQVAGFAALEIAVGAIVGMFVGARTRSEPSQVSAGAGSARVPWREGTEGGPVEEPHDELVDGAPDLSVDERPDLSADDTDTQEILPPGNQTADEGTQPRG